MRCISIREGGFRSLLLYSFLCVTADILDAICSILYPAKKPEVSLKPSDVDAFSDKQIKKTMRSTPPFFCDKESSVFRLSAGTVAKIADVDGSIDADELDLLEYDDDGYLCGDDDDQGGAVDCSQASIANILFEKTDIPVPRVRRVMKWGTDYIIVMDYIKGSTLAEVWPTYSIWRKIRVAFTLRRYVCQLRGVEAPAGASPGPLSIEGPKSCYVPSIFGDIRCIRGPFGSYKELTSFFNHRYLSSLSLYLSVWKIRFPENIMKEKFDDSSPLVITHNQLHPRHIIVGEDGRLWVVDWAHSGYYPPWFEYYAMASSGGWFDREWYDRFWELAVPFVCGPYFKQLEWLDRASPALTRL